jgi:hypothetical protein
MAGDVVVAPGRVHASLRSAAVVLALGSVSWAWSEGGFWSQFRSGDSAPTWILTWLAYSVVAGLALRLARRFPSAGLAPLVLVGAVYGWLVEGAIASTVYEQLPFSIIWTGVAWHGLLTVVLGWWAVPAALRAGGRRALLVCAAVGAAWGVWSAGWWAAVPDDGQPPATPSLTAYAAFVAVVWAAAALGYLVLDRLPLRAVDLRSRWATGLCIALVVAWAGLLIVPAIPWAPAVLGLLLLLGWMSLRRLAGRSDAAATPAPGSWPVGVPLRRLGPSLLVPVAAIAVYAALSPLAAGLGEGPLVAALPVGVVGLSLAGTALLGWALWRAWRPAPKRRPTEPAVATVEA